MIGVKGKQYATETFHLTWREQTERVIPVYPSILLQGWGMYNYVNLSLNWYLHTVPGGEVFVDNSVLMEIFDTIWDEQTDSELILTHSSWWRGLCGQFRSHGDIQHHPRQTDRTVPGPSLSSVITTYRQAIVCSNTTVFPSNRLELSPSLDYTFGIYPYLPY